MAVQIRTIVTEAAQELNLVGANETLSGADAAYYLSQLIRLINNWNAEEITVWTVDFSLFTLLTNTSPITIGPSGADFTVTARPVSVDGATLVLNTSSPPVDVPITLRDDDWWRGQTVKTLTSTVPTDLYYSPSFPNGSLYFWPIPTVAYQVRLEIRILLDEALTLNTMVNLPPGYRDALTLTLAEKIALPTGKVVPAPLELMARMARARIFANNDPEPNIQTVDYGLQTRPGNRPSWNYLIGSSRTSWS
jgi:hypothetical protein